MDDAAIRCENAPNPSPLRTAPTSVDRALVARLERRRHHRPVAPADYLPTPFGNVLRAAETRPTLRYGLDSLVVWPRAVPVPAPAPAVAHRPRGRTRRRQVPDHRPVARHPSPTLTYTPPPAAGP